ncbi:hypothetical protein L1987_20351 [Smallanthus sonchifolius]|uniref:Uncharacterized protein n=1 Tax=Smallanthus sonchifolius TaxID=185202 RepID=A0ACB9IR34_9ASTR|nr:hypothetical protein L1987_20351 [Smallanthus sonchifolius]
MKHIKLFVFVFFLICPLDSQQVVSERYSRSLEPVIEEAIKNDQRNRYVGWFDIEKQKRFLDIIDRRKKPVVIIDQKEESEINNGSEH